MEGSQNASKPNSGRRKRNWTTQDPPTKQIRSLVLSEVENDIGRESWWSSDWSTSDDDSIHSLDDFECFGPGLFDFEHVELTQDFDEQAEYLHDSASDDSELIDRALGDHETAHVEVAQEQNLVVDANVSVGDASSLQDDDNFLQGVDSSAARQTQLQPNEQESCINSLTDILVAKVLRFLERIETGQLKMKVEPNELPADFREKLRLAVATKINIDGIAHPINERDLNTCAAVFIIRFGYSRNTRAGLAIIPDFPCQEPRIKHLQGIGPACKAFGLPSRRTLRREVYRALGFPSSGTGDKEKFWFLGSDFTKARRRMLYFTHTKIGLQEEGAGQNTC